MLRDVLLDLYRRKAAPHQSAACLRARKQRHPLALAEYEEGERFYHLLAGATSIKVNYAADSILAFAPKVEEAYARDAGTAFANALLGVPITPPYPVTWLEWDHVVGEGYSVVPEVLACGALLERYDGADDHLRDDRNAAETIALANAAAETLAAGRLGLLTKEMTRDVVADAPRRWLVRVSGVAHLRRRPVRMPAVIGLYLDPEGKLVDRVLYADRVLTAQVALPAPEDRRNAIERWRIGGDMASYCASIATWACSLLHCKNITLVPRTTPASVQHWRRVERKAPLTDYHVLTVDPLKTPSLARAKAAGVRVEDVRLHMVRGHFRIYGSEGRGLLFGKLAGTYWIEDHLRGDVEAGLTSKDYALGATP